MFKIKKSSWYFLGSMSLLYFSDFITEKLPPALDMLLHLFVLIGFFYLSYKGYKASKEEDKNDVVDYLLILGGIIFVIKMTLDIFIK